MSCKSRLVCWPFAPSAWRPSVNPARADLLGTRCAAGRRFERNSFFLSSTLTSSTTTWASSTGQLKSAFRPRRSLVQPELTFDPGSILVCALVSRLRLPSVTKLTIKSLSMLPTPFLNTVSVSRSVAALFLFRLHPHRAAASLPTSRTRARRHDTVADIILWA